MYTLYKHTPQGDTLQNVANELECIITTGYYIFTFSQDNAGSSSAQIMLKYKPSTLPCYSQSSLPLAKRSLSSKNGDVSPDTVQTSAIYEESCDETDLRPNVECWNTEQISDFVRKLGFLDKEKDKVEGIRQFLHINEVKYVVSHYSRG